MAFWVRMYLISVVSTLLAFVTYVVVSLLILGDIRDIHNLGVYTTIVSPILWFSGPVVIQSLRRFGLFRRQNYLLWGMLASLVGGTTVVIGLYLFVPVYAQGVHDIYGQTGAGIALGVAMGVLMGVMPLLTYIGIFYALLKSRFLQAWDRMAPSSDDIKRQRY